MRTLYFESYDRMSKYAADMIAAQIRQKPDSVLGLATGSSPLGIYRELIGLYESGQLDFSQVTTFNLDEYCGMDYRNEQSYHYYMQENLFSKINVPASNIHLPDAAAADPDAECLSYERSIEQAGGIDLQLLGIGHDGHIGFNEPDSHFPAITHRTMLAEPTIQANRRFFASQDQVPKEALTMGIGTIMKARKILLIAFGADKEEIVRQAFTGPVVPAVPASVLQLHPDVTVLYGK
ncbi:MAG: glucosamine-6-phosphate deaminase [Lachnospiraceae bacterium]|nr:glucosamine-6-phosphate deaminase [Lachnospiraceae bacterium]